MYKGCIICALQCVVIIMAFLTSALIGAGVIISVLNSSDE